MGVGVGVSVGLALHLRMRSNTLVPEPALPTPATALVLCPRPVCRRSHLLLAGFVEVLATEAGGDEVATEGWDEGECGHEP